MKVLTILHLKVTKIQLRTYFYKYWSSVKYYSSNIDPIEPNSSRMPFRSRKNNTPKTEGNFSQKKTVMKLKINVILGSFSFVA